MTKQEIQDGLDRWSQFMAGAAQFNRYLEKRRATPGPAKGVPAPKSDLGAGASARK